MISFIYGNFGTGKTEYVFSQLQKDAAEGRRAFLIVPEQMTVSTERDVLLRLPPSGQLLVEVLNFSRLANRVFRERGGLVYNYASTGMRRLFMWRALRESAPLLREYGTRAADDRSLPDAVLGTFREFRSGGITPVLIEEAAASISDNQLSYKLRDIAASAAVYETLMGDKFTDSDNDLSHLCELLSDEPFFTDANVYIDSFTSLTGQEHDVVRLIMQQAHNTVITSGLPSPSFRGIDTLSLRACSDRLRSEAASTGSECKTVILNHNHRTSSAELAITASDLWLLGETKSYAIPEEYRGSIELLRSADIYDEAECCAAKIRQLAENGFHYGEILIVARSASKYRGILEPALETQGIPYFFSEKSELSTSALSRLILSALRIFIFGWRRDDLIAHLKTGLCCIEPRQADIFESYTAKWNINGKRFTDPAPWNMNPDGYTQNISERGKQILAISNDVRDILVTRLKKFYSELEGADGVPDMCRAVVDYLSELNVTSSLRAGAARDLAAGRIREAGENARIYDAVLDALDGLCDAFDGVSKKPDLKTFSDALQLVLDSTSIGSIPTAADEVTVGSADMLRADSPKCVILLGVCDGEFPASASDRGLLSDREREILMSHGISLSGSREERASDELYFFRRAAASASDKLIVFTRSDSTPSVAFNRLTVLFPYLKNKVTDTTADFTDRIRTPESAAGFVTLLDGTEEGEAIRKALASDALTATFLPPDPSEYPVSAAGDCVDETTARIAMGKQLLLSKTQIEKYVNCRFAYYCQYILKLDDGKEAAYSAANSGTFVHYILEQYLYEVFITRGGLFPDSDEQAKIIERLTEKYIDNSLPVDSGTRTARILYKISRLKQLAVLAVNDILAEISDGDFSPEFFELPIGVKGFPALSFSLKDGTEISITGIIDRVDIFRKDGKVYVRVVDYKTGEQVFSLDNVSKGIDLQLLIYIFSLTRGNNTEFAKSVGGIPVAAGITVYSTYHKKVPTKDPENSDTALREIPRQFTRSGFLLDNDDVLCAVCRSGCPGYLKKVKNKKLIMPCRSTEQIDDLYGQLSNVLCDIAGNMVGGHAEAQVRPNEKTCNYCRFASVCRASRPAKRF
ncbi:MAG: PD-(D/E)XK nuclease family protein [Clostridia bacterium]|nr:PD-(D/E)XK nuclease family protein [Clostridia bacterium]